MTLRDHIFIGRVRCTECQQCPSGLLSNLEKNKNKKKQVKEHPNRPNPPRLKAECFYKPGFLGPWFTRAGWERSGCAQVHRCTLIRSSYLLHALPTSFRPVLSPPFSFSPSLRATYLTPSHTHPHTHRHTPLSYQSGFSGLLEAAAQDRK